MYTHERQSGGAWIAGLIGGIFTTVGGLMAVGGYASDEWALVIFGLIFGGMGLLVMVIGIHSWMGESLFETLDLRTPRPDTLLGEEVTFELEFRARKAFRIDKLTAVHKLTETAIWRRGTDSTTYTEELHVQTDESFAPRDVKAGETVQHSVTFRMPAEAPGSFESSNNKLTWTFHVDLDVPGWPDPSTTWQVTMRPYLAPDALEDAAGVG